MSCETLCAFQSLFQWDHDDKEKQEAVHLLMMYLAMLGSEEDRERFTLLYEAHEKRLYAIALRVLGDPTQAEDAAQQAWLQVLRNWERVNALDWDVAAKYLAVTAKNAALDLLKKEKWNTSMPEDWDPPAPEDGQEKYQRLVELILSLPEAYRRVLELKFVEEETNQEIARRMGLKESTVSTKIQRGRKLLLDAMEREGYCYG